MTDAADKLLKDVLALSDRERAEIAARLVESLEADEAEDPDEVEAAWAAELERRCDALDAGTTGTTPWPEVRRGIESELRRK